MRLCQNIKLVAERVNRETLQDHKHNALAFMQEQMETLLTYLFCADIFAKSMDITTRRAFLVL
jgi:hypothetical protein